MPTGEWPDDPCFALGNIIVCTYDQLLSVRLTREMVAAVKAAGGPRSGWRQWPLKARGNE
jgi:hypothetical protein